jgi:hypothetical protein
MASIARFAVRVRCLLAASGLAFMGLSGCSTLDLQHAIIKPETDAPMDLAKRAAEGQPPTMPAALGMATVEIRAAGKSPDIKSLPLDGGTSISTTIDRLGVTKRFRRMDVQLIRAVGDQRQKLDVPYDRRLNTVKSLYDYALHPGDHLIITEDPRTIVDDMLESVAGPLGMNDKKKR